jgi:ATP-dependent helicase/nuclease subunit A
MNQPTAPQPNDATRAQIDAADPGASTWLSANAGSGKTRVLTDRVARLLLRGVPPQRILCLTYTKAAASEMQNRLFKRLGEWAMMPAGELQKNLLELGVSPAEIAPEALGNARSLFAKAIETPGGLKIQTIHSFCSSLLRRFPLEAKVSPAFTEMDDRTAKLLRADILEEIAENAQPVMAEFASHFTGDDIDKMLQQVSRRATDFETTLDEITVADLLGLPRGTTETSLLTSVFLGGETDLMTRASHALQTSAKPTDNTLGLTLAMIANEMPSTGLLAKLEGVFLTKSGANPFTPKAHPPTADGKAALGPDLDHFNQFRERVADARPARLALSALAKTKALHRFAAEFLPRLTREKEQRGWLDFDDLILRSRTLLTDPRVASWVLYRLDGGIDHVLVDEAQDTSPAQWDVIKLLTKEFFSGDGARGDTTRTIFVVGDQKQSIYSFQGADPAQFDDNRDYFFQELDLIGEHLQRQDLLYSFRSATPILKLVDDTFTDDLSAGMGDRIEHKAFKDALPGRVDLWPWIEGGEKDERTWDIDWFDPIDTVGSDHHFVQLASKIAGFIKDRIENGQIGGDKGPRAIEPGDFLILVQRRNQLFHEIIRACKAAKLDIAGADRLLVAAELGVKDITALLKYLATPEDDLSLAAALRSPLFGITEAQLFDLAHGRGRKTLRQVFEARQDEFPKVYNILKDLRDEADFLRPYELLERILTKHHGRLRIAARLGPEAEEGIAALLDLALQYETAEVPSLTGFLTWLAADDVTIKRQMDNSNNQIRVMTVHGAKGLEAPIVILPDTGNRKNDLRDDIFSSDAGPMWAAKTDDRPRAQSDIAEYMKTKQSQEAMRLLYVALTRAESWLVVCGAGAEPKLDKADWYAVIEAGMQTSGAANAGDILRLDHATFPPDIARSLQQTGSRTALPNWLTAGFVEEVERQQSLSPSDLGGAKALPTADALSEDAAKARGTAIHSLLEHLPNSPQDQWPAIAKHLLGDQVIEGTPDPFTVAQNVITAAHLSHIFAPDTLAEAPITGTILALGDRIVNGVIDRLIIEDDKITAVDFKSNATVPATPETIPEGVLRQMGAYLALLEQIYPDKPIEIAILWTATAIIMTVPHDIVREALSRAHIS